MLVLGLALLVTPSLGRSVRPLAAMGAMTLTLYAVHVVVAAATSGQHPGRLWWGQVVAFAVFAVAWSRAHPRGPLETLVAGAAGRSSPWAAAR